MRDTTKKLSGPQKDKFFERLYAGAEGIDAQAAARLTQRTAEAISSVHVRAKAYELIRQAKSAPRVAATSRQPAQPVADAATPKPRPTAPPPAEAATAAPAAAPAAKPFDPYAFGLVPLYQKEGREALLARLDAVASVDQLRQIARAQQVSLPQELRSGEASLDTLRTAILDAVAKRIADRKAAAG